MSILISIRETLENAHPRELTEIGHDERLRLAATLRSWAWAAEQADHLALADFRIGRVIRAMDAPKAGVLADLHDGERAL